LQLSKAGSPPKLTLVTSACPGEGKTVTAVNTAILLAGCNARVLLVDADLRRSRCHEVLQCESRVGLTEVLTGLVKPDEVIRQTSIKTLFLLSAGSRAPNPAELLGSDVMGQTLTHLKAQFDYVVIDSAPVMPVSDATILSTMVDGVMLVVATAVTSKRHVRAALAKLEYARAKVFGTVLNRARLQTPNYAHYYTHVHYLEHMEGSAAELLQTAPKSDRRV
jgi:capsular exopolysaccharide synthesis family protein